MVRRAVFVALVFVVFFSAPFPSDAGIDPIYLERLEALKREIEQHGFAPDELTEIFSDSRFKLYPQIVGRRGKGLDYFGSRFGLLTKKSIEQGREVLARHNAYFKDAERVYGVDREVIAAILRVETNFGSVTGIYPVLNSLTTLVVVENRRSEWAQSQVIKFLKICRDQEKDPFSIRGSWAGAFGISQFIPSSYLRYAVDGDGDGVVDLFNWSDAIASIANYLKVHGWEKDKPDRKRQAVFSYNHCDNYVNAVLAYAGALKE